MRPRRDYVFLILIAIAAGACGAGIAFFVANKNRVEVAIGETRSGVLSMRAPPGTITIEMNPAYKGAAAPGAAVGPSPAAADWPSYNKTLSSERFSDLSQINTKNVANLKVLCTYDTGRFTSFETGLIMVQGSLIGTTEFDIFSVNPATCAENWRTHEEYPAYILPTNRGAAYLDGMLFRGTEDGRVLAYDFKTGKRLWETTIADVKKGEAVPAAPIAWEGLVFIGNCGGDMKGGKGHMFALEAKTGKIVWEFFLVPKVEGDTVRGPLSTTPLDSATWKNVPGAPISGGGMWTSMTLDAATGLLYVPVGNPAPDYDNAAREGENLYTDSVVVLDAKTGAYKNHYQIVPRDWHDWDVSNPPVLFQTAGGKQLMAVSPKDGYLYGFDRADNKLLYKTPVTTIENVDEPFSTGKDVHFCPGAGGGEEWNSPAYDPVTNLIFTGDVDWCTTVKLQSRDKVLASSIGQPWIAENSLNPFNLMGKFTRADGVWGGGFTPSMPTRGCGNGG
jgi:alcohol dehydrogenase (cytochrome c)